MAGRPKGIPQVGKYGVGVKTKSVRVPVDIADKVGDILNAYRCICQVTQEWQERILDNEDCLKEPRHLSALQLLEDIREHLAFCGDFPNEE